LASLESIPLGDEALDDAAWHLEAKLGVGYFNVAGQDEFSGTGANVGRAGGREQDGGEEGGGRQQRPTIRFEGGFHRR
jgi:hypothetical protein